MVLIEVEGSGNINLLPDKVVSDTSMDCQFSNNKLTIFMKESSNISFSSSGVTMTGNHYGNSVLHSNGTVIINGVRVTQSDLDRIARKNNDSAQDDGVKEYVWEQPQEIEGISIEGNSIIMVEAPLSESVALNVVGNGEIHAGTQDIQSLTTNLQGNGDITGKNRVQNMMINLMGNGDITGFYIESQLNVSLMGNGDVNVKAGPNCRVSKSVMGNGDVRV